MPTGKAIFPAYAGLIPSSVTADTSDVGILRIRGVDPPIPARCSCVMMYSPHKRGFSLADVRQSEESTPPPLARGLFSEPVMLLFGVGPRVGLVLWFFYPLMGFVL